MDAAQTENKLSNTSLSKDVMFYTAKDRPKRSIGLGQIGLALAKAQGEIENAEKDVKGNYGKYSTLAATWNSIRGPLAKNEIAVFQRPMKIDDELTMCTMLIHSSGEFIDDSELEMIVDVNNRMNAMQALGSATTYSRRYTLQAAVGIAPEDDDGNASGDVDGEKRQNKGNQQQIKNNSNYVKKETQNPNQQQQQTQNTPPPKISEDQNEQIANLMMRHSLEGSEIEYLLKTGFNIDDSAQTTFAQAEYIIKFLDVELLDSEMVKRHADELKVKREQRSTQADPADYVIDDRILSEGSPLKSKKLRQIDEKSLRGFIDATDIDLKADPKPAQYKLIFEANFKAKSFLKSMGV